jgi:TolB protein
MRVRSGALAVWVVVSLMGMSLAIVACRSASSVSNDNSTPVASPSAQTTPQATAETGEWKEYTNPDFAASLRYPGDWQQTGDARFEGQDGFSAMDAMSSGYSLEDTCAVVANHTLKPYGSNPTIEYLTIQGATGCLILPSGDAPPSEKSLSTLILAYPAPVRVHCNETAHFNYFVLDADKDHIRQIADTVSFITPVPTPSDCPTVALGTP